MPTLQFKGRNIIWNHHLSFGKVNDKAEFYRVEQGIEDGKIRTLFAGNDTTKTSHHAKYYAKKRKSKGDRKGKK